MQKFIDAAPGAHEVPALTRPKVISSPELTGTLNPVVRQESEPIASVVEVAATAPPLMPASATGAGEHELRAPPLLTMPTWNWVMWRPTGANHP
jgi:hypothetical protein